jgi:hypothetical protein
LQEETGLDLRNGGVDKNDLHNVFPISTGPKSGDGLCYAVAFDGTWIWAAFATSPGTITRIDPNSLTYQNYALEFSTPNEIVFDGKRLLVTYWGQNPGRIQAFDPQYLNGREIP